MIFKDKGPASRAIATSRKQQSSDHVAYRTNSNSRNVDIGRIYLFIFEHLEFLTVYYSVIITFATDQTKQDSN